MFLNTASVPRECKMKSLTLTLKLCFLYGTSCRIEQKCKIESVYVLLNTEI